MDTTTPPPTITAPIVQRLRAAADKLEANPLPGRSGHVGTLHLHVHDVSADDLLAIAATTGGEVKLTTGADSAARVTFGLVEYSASDPLHTVSVTAFARSVRAEGASA